jgi:hypothetical protein
MVKTNQLTTRCNRLSNNISYFFANQVMLTRDIVYCLVELLLVVAGNLYKLTNQTVPLKLTFYE